MERQWCLSFDLVSAIHVTGDEIRSIKVLFSRESTRNVRKIKRSSESRPEKSLSWPAKVKIELAFGISARSSWGGKNFQFLAGKVRLFALNVDDVPGRYINRETRVRSFSVVAVACVTQTRNCLKTESMLV